MLQAITKFSIQYIYFEAGACKLWWSSTRRFLLVLLQFHTKSNTDYVYDIAVLTAIASLGKLVVSGSGS